MGWPIFKDNVVVITGASQGIGRELALQLAQQGAMLALAAREIQRLEELCDECLHKGATDCLAIQTDVSNELQCERLIQNTAKHYGRLDTLINNAGVSMEAAFEDVQDSSQFATILGTNVLGSMYCTRYALPHLKQVKGRLVVLSSIAGKTGVPGYSVYAASKHALVGFFESIRIETEKYGVTVTIIMPDFVSSGIHEREVDAFGKPMGDRHRVDYSKVMDVGTCAHQIIKAAAGRKRQVIMSWRGKVGQWVKLIAPGIIDDIARRAKGY